MLNIEMGRKNKKTPIIPPNTNNMSINGTITGSFPENK